MTSQDSASSGRPGIAVATTDGAFATSDRRLALAARLIEQGKLDWLSLDVFDTTIYRHVLEPKDLFLIVGHELEKRGALFPTDTAEAFFSFRITAENNARKDYYERKKLEEIGLPQIYEFLPQKRFRMPLAEIMALELETEYRLTRPNMEIFALIAYARRHKVKISFASDTYKDGAFLLRLLQKGDPDIKPDLLLSSRDHGVAKARGLMDIFLKKSGADPRRVLHIGDNPKGDVLAGRQKKIRTLYLRKQTYDFLDILTDEWHRSRAARLQLIHPTEGDFGLSWLRARIAFSKPPDSAHWVWHHWGATILGPLLTIFADWAADRIRALAAEHGGLPTLLCLMREGRLLASLLRIRAPDIVTHETWINRYVALKACLFKGDAKDVERYITRPHRPTVEQFCAELKIPLPPNIKPEAELVEGALAAFQHYLEIPKIKKHMEAESRIVRDQLLRHIENQYPDAFKTGFLPLLDLGFSGTIQRALQRILNRRFDGKVQSYGLYLGTLPSYTTHDPALLAEGWVMASGIPIDLSHILPRSPEPLEQACMSIEGTLIGHDKDGDPICDKNPIPPDQIAQIQAVQEGILAFAARCPKLPAADPHLIMQMQRLLVRMLALPTHQEAMAIGNWRHDENLGNIHTRSLVSTAEIPHFDYLPIADAARLINQQLPWLFAAARRHSRLMSQRLYSVFSSIVESDLFFADDDDSRTVKCIVLMDYGSGFDSKNSSLVLAPRTDRGIIRINCGLICREKWPKSIAIRLGVSPNDVFSPLLAKLFVHDANGKQVPVQELKGPKDFAIMHPFNVEAVMPHLFRLTESNGALIWPMPALPQTRGVLGIEFIFSIMKNDAAVFALL